MLSVSAAALLTIVADLMCIKPAPDGPCSRRSIIAREIEMKSILVATDGSVLSGKAEGPQLIDAVASAQALDAMVRSAGGEGWVEVPPLRA